MKKVLAILLCIAMCLSGVSALAHETLEVKNVLTTYWGFQKIVGIVIGEDTETLSIVVTKNYTNGGAYYEKGQCVTFEVIHKKSDSLLGYRIDAYVKPDGDKNVIIAGDSDNGRNNIVTLSPDMIEEFTPEKLVYRKEEKRIECELQNFVEVNGETIDLKCNVVVNGKLNPDFDVYEEYKNLEEITFLDNDKDGDFEFIVVNTQR